MRSPTAGRELVRLGRSAGAAEPGFAGRSRAGAAQACQIAHPHARDRGINHLTQPYRWPMYRKGVIVDPDPRRGQVASGEPAIDGLQHPSDQWVEFAVSPDRDLPIAVLSQDEFGVELAEFA